MRKQSLYFIPILAGLLLAACSSVSTSGSLIGTWELISYGPPSNLNPAVSGVDASIVFGEDGKVSGNVGCNGFSGDYTVERDKITFGPISSTLMICSDTAVGDQETVVLNTLSGTATYTLDEETLIITSGDGTSVVSLVRQ